MPGTLHVAWHVRHTAAALDWQGWDNPWGTGLSFAISAQEYCFESAAICMPRSQQKIMLVTTALLACLDPVDLWFSAGHLPEILKHKTLMLLLCSL